MASEMSELFIIRCHCGCDSIRLNDGFYSQIQFLELYPNYKEEVDKLSPESPIAAPHSDNELNRGVYGLGSTVSFNNWGATRTLTRQMGDYQYERSQNAGIIGSSQSALQSGQSDGLGGLSGAFSRETPF